MLPERSMTSVTSRLRPAESGLAAVRRQSGQEQEVAPADLGVGVGEERGRDVGTLAEKRQPERPGLGPGVRRELDGGLGRLRPRRPQPMARRIDRRDRRGRRDLDRDLPGNGVFDRLAPRQDVIDPIAVRRQQMLVGQPDRLRPSRLDREDAGAHQVEPGKLQKRGVAGLGDDAIVGLPALVPRQQPGRRLRAASLEREAPDDRAVGNGHQQLGLLPRPGRVAELDLHHRGRNPVADDHADGHARDLQARANAPARTTAPAERPGATTTAARGRSAPGQSLLARRQPESTWKTIDCS